MSETGMEQKYIKEAFDTNWVVPLGPNVNGFEEDLAAFVTQVDECRTLASGKHGAQLDQKEAQAQHEAQAQQEAQAQHKAQLDQKEAQLAKKEAQLAKKEALASKRVVALSSGTAAIHLALLACGVGPGDEVVVQSFTFAASANPVTYLRATPVFVDSEAETWNMDPELLEVAIKDRIAQTGRKPKAIIPVALYGMPYQIDRIMEIANRYDIPVIEDAAEGLGSRYNGQMLGTFGRYGVLSFNGNKMITTSGGGALICPDKEAADTIMWYATQARESYPYYQHEAIGYNYRLSNVCAGIGRGQMTVLEEHLKHHRHVQALYQKLFEDIDKINVHRSPTTGKYDSNYWLCTILLNEELRIKNEESICGDDWADVVGGAPNAHVEALRLALDEAGVESRPVWKPMHLQPVYLKNEELRIKNEELRIKNEELSARACSLSQSKATERMKNEESFGNQVLKEGVIRQTTDASISYINGVSESIFRRGLCLPAGPCVTDDDVRYIVKVIKEHLSQSNSITHSSTI